MSEEEKAKLEMDNFVLAEENRKLQEENEKLKNYEYIKALLQQAGDLKERINELQEENKELKRKKYIAHIDDKGKMEFVFDNYISKDKIKEALGDENIPDEMILTHIETLVSENNRLENIEDRKIEIEYNNVFNKGVKWAKDEICELINKTIDDKYTCVKELEDLKKRILK